MSTQNIRSDLAAMLANAADGDVQPALHLAIKASRAVAEKLSELLDQLGATSARDRLNALLADFNTDVELCLKADSPMAALVILDTFTSRMASLSDQLHHLSRPTRH